MCEKELKTNCICCYESMQIESFYNGSFSITNGILFTGNADLN